MLIDVTDFTFAYEGSHDYIFERVSFRLDSAWRLGFTGRNGRGKTTFLRCLMGELPYSGSILAPGLVFAYFPVRVDDPSLSTLDALAASLPGIEAWRLTRELSKLGIDGEMLSRPFRTGSRPGPPWRRFSPARTSFPSSTNPPTTWTWPPARWWAITSPASPASSW